MTVVAPTRPFQLTSPEPPERELQATVAAALDKLVCPPAVWFSAAIGATKLSAQQAAALSRQGVKRGLPDVLVVHDARIFGIELKLRKGTLSKTRVVRTRKGSPRILEGQEETFPKLEAAGMTIAIARSLDEVLATLQQWRIPLRGRLA